MRDGPRATPRPSPPPARRPAPPPRRPPRPPPHAAGQDAHRIAGAEVRDLRVLLEWNDRFHVHGNLAQFTVRPPEGQATPAPPRSAPPRPGGQGGAAPG